MSLSVFRTNGAAALLASLALCSLARDGHAQSSGPGAQRLPETVVTAHRFPTSLDRVGSSITVITAEQIRERQATSIADILRTVPGLAVSRSGGIGTQTQVRIRGAEANQTLVLIDGVEVNNPAANAEFELAHLLTSEIERIEVLRGAQSSLYGSDAVGGVINIITKKGKGPMRTTLSAEGGSFGTGRADGSVSGSTGRVNYALGSGIFHTDGISTASRHRGFSEKDGYWQRASTGRLGASLTENLGVELVGRMVDSVTDTDATGQDPNVAIDAAQDTRFSSRTGRASGTLDLLDGAWQQTIGFGTQDTRNRSRNTLNRETSMTDGAKSKADYQSTARYSSGFLLDADHSTVFGLEHEDEGIVSKSAFSDLNRRLTTTSAYAEQGIALQDTVFLTAGLRHDRNQLFPDANTYRFTSAYRATDTTKFKATYGTAVKAPTLTELFGQFSSFIGNPNLQPESSRGFDYGLEQDFLNRTLHLDVTRFHNRIKNLITGQGNTAVNVAGETWVDGIETALTWRPWSDWDFGSAYTYTRTLTQSRGPLVRRPRHIASFTATHRFLDNRASTTLGIDYNGNVQDSTFHDVSPFTRRTTLDSYTLVRLTGSYKLTEKVELFARGENLLDEQYEEVFGFATPGRAFFAGTRLTF